MKLIFYCFARFKVEIGRDQKIIKSLQKKETFSSINLQQKAQLLLQSRKKSRNLPKLLQLSTTSRQENSKILLNVKPYTMQSYAVTMPKQKSWSWNLQGIWDA